MHAAPATLTAMETNMTFATLIDRLGIAASFAAGLGVAAWALCGLEAASMG